MQIMYSTCTRWNRVLFIIGYISYAFALPPSHDSGSPRGDQFLQKDSSVDLVNEHDHGKDSKQSSFSLSHLLLNNDLPVLDMAESFDMDHNPESSLQPDIRALYRRHFPAAELVSPVELYRFCLREYSFNFAKCFHDVDKLFPAHVIPQARLFFLYDLFDLYSAPSNHALMMRYILDNTKWVHEQRNALLYYSASNSAYFPLIFSHFCGQGNTQFEGSSESLTNSCRKSWFLRLPFATEISDRVRFITGLRHPIMQEEMREFARLQAQLCTLHEDLDLFERKVYILLSQGANIHDPCFKTLLLNSVLDGERASDFVPSTGAFLRSLLTMGLNPQSGVLQSPSLLHRLDDPELIRISLEAGANPNHRMPGYSPSPSPILAHLFDKKRVHITSLLLQYGADPNAIEHSTQKTTPLMLVKHVHEARLLLNAGANPNSQDFRNETALFYAARNTDNPGLLALLLSRGAQLDACDVTGQTVLAVVQHLNVMHYLLNLPSTSDLIDVQDSLGHSALHLMVLRGRLSMVRALIDAGANPNLQDFTMALTPVMLTNERNLIRFLISQPKVNLNIQDRHGNTALMRAVKAGKIAVVELLLNAGADASVRNFLHPSQSAIDIAREKGYTVYSTWTMLVKRLTA